MNNRGLCFRLLAIIAGVLIMVGACSRAGKNLDLAETLILDHPDSAYSILSEIDTTGLSENLKARRALLVDFLATVYSDDANLTPADQERVKTYFNGKYNTDEVKALIVKSEIAKANGQPVERLEILKDAEFLATRLNDQADLGFVYLFLSNAYSNGFNGVVSEHYAKKALEIFNALHHRKQSIDARMAIVGAICVERNYARMLDSMLAIKPDVMLYSTPSYQTYFQDQLARSLDERGRSEEALEIWSSIYTDIIPNSNTLAHWALAYMRTNRLDSAETLIKRALKLPHGPSDEYLCRNVQYQIWQKLGKKNELPGIAELREKAGKVDYEERKIADTSLAINKKHETTTREAWREREKAFQRNYILVTVAIVLLLILLFTVIYFRRRTKMLRIENENNLLKLRDLEANLFEKEQRQNIVADKISGLFKTRFKTIDQLAAAYFECKETGQEQKRIFQEAKTAIADFTSQESLRHLEEILNTSSDNLMAHFDEDFPKMSAAQRRLALFIFCGLSPQSISVFQGVDLRNIYVYKSRLKTTISKSGSPRKEQYLAYFS